MTHRGGDNVFFLLQTPILLLSDKRETLAPVNPLSAPNLPSAVRNNRWDRLVIHFSWLLFLASESPRMEWAVMLLSNSLDSLQMV